ncbi:MAG: 2Fe-2S iron-sulfur cluster-binding protein [Myxococcota bacterium]
MGATDRVLQRHGACDSQTRPEDHPTVSLRWDRDRVVSARRGDTVSLALLDEGILETSLSVKYRRSRGAYCLRGDCGTCLVRINGLPNRRACMTRVAEGMRVQPQNRLVAGPDPTTLIDTMMRSGIDHHHLMVRPRVVNQIMQGVARGLTGLGTLPDAEPDHPARHEEHRPDVLVVGAGPAGRRAFEVLEESGREVLWVDRLDRIGLEGQTGHALPDALLDETGIFGVYPQERLWSAMSNVPGEPMVLRSIYPRHVVVATGARDPTIPVANNDRPGVVAARGLVQQLARGKAQLKVEAVVIGKGTYAQGLADALAAQLVAPEDVESIEGNPVDSVRLSDGKRSARLVALAAPPAPAFELARQAGARVRWDGGGFAVEIDDLGRCLTEPWLVWAAGDVTGYKGNTAAADDGERIARSLLQHDR